MTREGSAGMEKFTSWRDKGTGVSPFMPIEARQSRLRAVLLILVAIARIPFLVLCLSFYWIFSAKWVARFIVKTLFGFTRVEFLVDGVKKSRPDLINKNRPRRGDFILVNYTSAIDGWIVAALSRVNYKDIALVVPDKNQKLHCLSIWQFFTHTLTPLFKENQDSVITDIAQLRDKLVFCFAEGTATNNNAVLPFILRNLNDEIKSHFTIRTMVLKISPISLTTPLPTVSGFSYLLQLLANVNDKSAIRAKIFTHSDTELGDPLAYLRRCFEFSLLPLIGEELNITKKESFYNYYTKTKK